MDSTQKRYNNFLYMILINRQNDTVTTIIVRRFGKNSIVLDFNGINRLSNALISIEVRWLI